MGQPNERYKWLVRYMAKKGWGYVAYVSNRELLADYLAATGAHNHRSLNEDLKSLVRIGRAQALGGFCYMLSKAGYDSAVRNLADEGYNVGNHPA